MVSQIYGWSKIDCLGVSSYFKKPMTCEMLFLGLTHTGYMHVHLMHVHLMHVHLMHVHLMHVHLRMHTFSSNYASNIVALFQLIWNTIPGPSNHLFILFTDFWHAMSKMFSLDIYFSFPQYEYILPQKPLLSIGSIHFPAAYSIFSVQPEVARKCQKYHSMWVKQP